MAGELSDITDQRRRAPTSRSGEGLTFDIVGDQLGVLRRAIAGRSLHPDLSYDLRRNSEGAWLVIVDSRTNTETLIAGPSDWAQKGTYGGG